MKPIDSRIKVDIDNDRIVDNDVVKLSREDFVIDYSGKKITLEEGMYIFIQMIKENLLLFFQRELL